MALQSLTSIFKSNQSVLGTKLQGLKLPSDSSRIQGIINDYLNEMFNNEGDFRQGLTQSEDYILQAALSLLNAQQSITKEITPDIILQEPKPKTQSPIIQTGLKKEQYPVTLTGTAIGGGIGGILLGTWGAVFGAIAGTAIVLYYASSGSQSISKMLPETLEKTKVVESQLNVDLFLSIIKSICESVDSLIELRMALPMHYSLIDTFRAQINKVVYKYENQEKPTLEKEYRFLLESVQSLIGYKRAHNEDEKFLRKIQERIEDIAEVLDNYNLTVEDYTEEHKNWFDLIENPNTTKLTQILPAIVKENNVVLKGRIFIPEILK